MESKYYTPDIEEIYNNISLHYFDGFEVKDNIFVNPYIFIDDLQTINIGKDFEIEKVRIKYLDKEDIESLGWKGQEANSVYFKKDKYRLVHWLTNNEIGRDISIYESYDGGTQEEALVRKAIIKNKSELKKLLKQLQIE